MGFTALGIATALVVAVVVIAVVHTITAPTKQQQRQAGPTESASPAAAAPGDVAACVGGRDPAKAAETAMKEPATDTGAARAAGAVSRWINSLEFGGTTVGLDTVKAIAAPGGDLAKQQKAANVAYKPSKVKGIHNTADFYLQGGQWVVKSNSNALATVWVLGRDRLSNFGSVVDQGWNLEVVDLQRMGDKWGVLSAENAPSDTAVDLNILGVTKAKASDTQRYAAELEANGFRPFVGADCR